MQLFIGSIGICCIFVIQNGDTHSKNISTEGVSAQGAFFKHFYNMEIFRTDGGGRTVNPPRLLDSIGFALKIIPNNSIIWQKIKSIHDQQGYLTVTLYSRVQRDKFTHNLLLSAFKYGWTMVGENPEKVEVSNDKH